MTLNQLKDNFREKYNELLDPDDFDRAYYEAIEHVLGMCGDGGISENYIKGLRDALDALTPRNISNGG